MAKYIYKKYNTNTTTTYTWRQYDLTTQNTYKENRVKDIGYQGSRYYYTSYSFNTSTGKFNLTGTKISDPMTMKGKGYYYGAPNISGNDYITYGDTNDWGFSPDTKISSTVMTTQVKGSYRGTVTSTSSTAYPTNGQSGSYWYDTRTSETEYSRGSYIGEVIAEDGTYPINGLHSDGYWYVRGEIALLAIYKNQTIKTIKHKNQDINKLYNRGETIWQKAPDVYLAQDSDFVNVNGYWIYRGTALRVEIPTHINGELVTSTTRMFSGVSSYAATPVTKVVLKHFHVTSTNYMFTSSSATTLDLSSFNTSNVTSMNNMFTSSSATTLDLSSFNTSNVTSMSSMFQGSSATTLDLSSFNTSNVTSMSQMFRSSSATTLDLSSFDTSNVTSMNNMFYDSLATTGYARTQADANKFNASSNKPTGLNFVVKP